MDARPPDPDLQTALAVVGYQWALRADEFPTGPIDAVEALHAATSSFPDGHVPLSELYPHVVRLATLSLGALAALGHPDEVDGLRGFEGFDLWLDSR